MLSLTRIKKYHNVFFIDLLTCSWIYLHSHACFNMSDLTLSVDCHLEPFNMNMCLGRNQRSYLMIYTTCTFASNRQLQGKCWYIYLSLLMLLVLVDQLVYSASNPSWHCDLFQEGKRLCDQHCIKILLHSV